MPSPLASHTKTRLSRDARKCSCLTLWTPTVGLYGGRINTCFSDDPSTVDVGRLISEGGELDGIGRRGWLQREDTCTHTHTHTVGA